MELHPRINIDSPRIKYSKIILGSFPTWSLTTSDDNEFIEIKSKERRKNGDFEFFYGSANNRFWRWYKNFIDPEIITNDITLIEQSLEKNNIGITDVIVSCVRKDKSALDKHLTERTYNHSFLYYPEIEKTFKIMCTSKGVMNDMLLTGEFFKKHPRLKINEKKSMSFQHEMLREMNGNQDSIGTSLFKHLDCDDGGSIECLAIPSPGSPYRKLTNFGLKSQNLDHYLNRYLNYAFEWFKI